jgi:hypothetical protein
LFVPLNTHRVRPVLPTKPNALPSTVATVRSDTMTLSMNKLKRTRKDQLISLLLSAQCRAELQAQRAEEAERALATQQRQETQRRGAAPKSAWLEVFDHVKRDANPHGEYINCRLRKGGPVITIDFIKGNLLPYARKISEPKVDRHGHAWINVYY